MVSARTLGAILPTSRPAQALPEGTIDALRRGEVEAFRTVYATQHTRLYTFLLRLTRDPALAQDLAQETWLRLAANARRLTPDTEPGAWLFRVARNLFVSQRRWAIVHEAGLTALRGILGRSSPASPLESLAANTTERQLEAALAALPLRYREVILLSAIEGFSAPEVASMLGIEPATVRQRLARGRATLKKALSESAEPELEP